MAWLSNMPRRRPFICNCQAAVLVEFALLLPLLLTLLFGAYVMSRGYYAMQKVDLVAHNLADLTARKADCNGDATRTCLSAADVQDIFSAGAVLMSPLPTGSLEMTISEIGVLQGAQGRKVETSWSITRNGQMRAC